MNIKMFLAKDVVSCSVIKMLQEVKTKKNSDLYTQIYELVRCIPAGRVSTYGAIAAALGVKSGARVVGYAMNHSHATASVPAHRVVNSQGLLTGKHHFETPGEMQRLLELEGITVVKDQVQQFREKFWDPLLELA